MPSTARDQQDPEPRSSQADALLCIAFFAMLVTPLVVQLAGLGNDDVTLSREQREPTPAPTLPHDLESWERFPATVDDWYAERFGLRNQLLYASQWTRARVFGMSPSDDKILGPNGWLFVGGREVLESYRGTDPFTRDELDRWRASIEGRRDWLASRGIDYALVLVPIKQEVYPEELPARFRQVAESRREQFLRELRTVDGLTVIDLLPTLLAAKDEDGEYDHLFYPLGSHWTDRGALEGYRAIIANLPERHRNRRLLHSGDFEPVGPGRQDDLSRQFLVDVGTRQAEPRLLQVTAHPTRFINGVQDDGSCGLAMWRHEIRRRTNVFVQRDSFGAAVLPYIAQNFSDVTEVNSLQFTPALIESVEPDLVIEMFVDQTLAYQVPHVQRVYGAAELAKRFDELPHILLPGSTSDSPPKIEGLLGTQLHATPDGVRIDVESTVAVALPPFRYTRDGLTILRVEITAPAPTVMTVHYPTPGVRMYIEKQSSSLRFAQAGQVVYLELPPQQRDASLAVVPGCAPGTYIIHDVEARTDEL